MKEIDSLATDEENVDVVERNLTSFRFSMEELKSGFAALLNDLESEEDLDLANKWYINQSGKINEQKQPEEPLDIAWPKDPVFVFGIHFSYDDEAAFKRNFEQKLSSMASFLNLWYPRNLTLHGRIVILKALSLSKLIYNTAVLTVTPTFIQKLIKLLLNSSGKRKNQK